MIKDARRYILKLYDEELVRFDAQIDFLGNMQVDILDVNESKKAQRPVVLIEQINGSTVQNWLESRTIPKNRQFVNEILAQAGLAYGDTLGIIDVCKGLSVGDAFWVDTVGEEQSWKDVNLFENELDETLSLVAYTGFTDTQRHKLGLSTEWTSEGQFAKAWRRLDDNLVLYKAGSEGFANAGMEPYSEYFASQLADKMGLRAVRYNLDMWKGKLASTCPLLNNEDTALVPFYVATGQSRFPTTMAIAAGSTPDIFEDMRTMTVFDALICNTDRHAGNYGFLRDNLTGKIVGMAPLYDHNLSLFARDMKTDYKQWPARANSVMTPATGRLSFLEQCQLVMGEIQHEQLRRVIGFHFENHPAYPIPDDRLGALNTYFTQRCAELLNIPCADTKHLNRVLEKERSSIKEHVALFELLDDTPVSLDIEGVRCKAASKELSNEGAIPVRAPQDRSDR